jgi:type I restriction enzyme S subunit
MSCVALKDYPRATYNGFTKRMRPKDNRVLPEYIGYYMRMPSFRNRFQAFSTMTTRASLKNEDLLGLEIALPGIEEQAKISGILMAYDDLIENNQKQIKLLEEAAQRLYKEWFIDLRFPGYENTPVHDGVPEGWERASLGELIEFNPKYAVSKEAMKRTFPMSALSTSSMVLDWSESEMNDSSSGAKFSNGDTLLARITPCLENGKTAYVDGLSDGEVAVGSTEFIVMRSKKLNPYMVYLLARSTDFRETAINSMTGSDGRQRAQVDKLKQYLAFCPRQNDIDQFECIAKPIFDQVYFLNKQNAELKEARDRLLPKLMSGEIEV